MESLDELIKTFIAHCHADDGPHKDDDKISRDWAKQFSALYFKIYYRTDRLLFLLGVPEFAKAFFLVLGQQESYQIIQLSATELLAIGLGHDVGLKPFNHKGIRV